MYRVDGAFHLVDFPGYGYAQVSKLERTRFKHLYREYLTSRELLRGVVWLLDLRHAPSTEDIEMGALLSSIGVPVLAALTKADKIKRGARAKHVAEIIRAVGIPEDQAILTSAANREGIGDLRDSIDAFIAA